MTFTAGYSLNQPILVTETYPDGIVVDRYAQTEYNEKPYFVHVGGEEFGDWYQTKQEARDRVKELQTEKYELEAAKLDAFVSEARENLLHEIGTASLKAESLVSVLTPHVIEALRRFEQQVRQSAALAGRYHSRK